MSFCLLFYQPVAAPDLSFDDLCQALAQEPGMDVGGAAGDAYRPLDWTHPTTGARVIGDAGSPPLAEDDLHPPTTYDGWQAIPLSFTVSLTVPHWHCVEIGRMVERLLTRLPDVTVLNTEDTQRSDDPDDVGPAAFDRTRLLACWEQLHAAQVSLTDQQPVMARTSSVALWRYRSERTAGAAEYDSLRWPEALVLSDGGSAHSAVIWPATDGPWALPPVEVVIFPDEHPPQVRPVTDLLAQIDGDVLGYGGAVRVPDISVGQRVLATGDALQLDRYRAVADGDWLD